MTSKHEYIEKAAYFIWLNRGCPDGQALEIWDEAAKLYELTQRIVKPLAPKTSNTKKASKKKVATKKVAKPKAKTTATKKVATTKKAEVKATKPTTKVVKAKQTKKPAKKVVAKKTTSKPVVKPTTKLAEKTAPKKVEVAKIIPMPKKETEIKKTLTPKTKIKIVVGGKK